MNKSFISYELEHKKLVDLSDDEFPTKLRMWNGKEVSLNLPWSEYFTHFGYVYEGVIRLHNSCGDSYELRAGMYFSLPGGGIIWGDGSGIVVTHLEYKGMFSIGGPVEETGRLRYVSGCTDSLLIPPVMKGDPCFNALYFPPHIEQVPHTHPSIRVGMVVSGEGQCVMPEGVTNLEPGQAFVIPANQLHSFWTLEQPLVVVAFHPDSDYGPTHEDHPMLNKTIVDGVSAAKLERVRTHAS
ncbi:cupin domain-containing protein [Chroococcidiopsis sp.]|uniref:cupin domain-containing protein n=1 Tax=Chroococcidiopsis sp. TaxID=3088168 RepID=UPI003F34C1E4